MRTRRRGRDTVEHPPRRFRFLVKRGTERARTKEVCSSLSLSLASANDVAPRESSLLCTISLSLYLYSFYDLERRRKVRRVYYSMIAEWDEMVGCYVEAVERAAPRREAQNAKKTKRDYENTAATRKTRRPRDPLETLVLVQVAESALFPPPLLAAREKEARLLLTRRAGVSHKTVFVVTSDHGDMQMEKQQFYKMVPFEASVRVPLVIFDGRHPRESGLVLSRPTQLIDLFPTFLALARAPEDEWPEGLDGASLLPLMAQTDVQRDFVVSQFHGDNLATSWFAVVAQTLNTTYKLVQWGDGVHHAPRLFDLEQDPSEDADLAELAFVSRRRSLYFYTRFFPFCVPISWEKEKTRWETHESQSFSLSPNVACRFQHFEHPRSLKRSPSNARQPGARGGARRATPVRRRLRRRRGRRRTVRPRLLHRVGQPHLGLESATQRHQPAMVRLLHRGSSQILRRDR